MEIEKCFKKIPAVKDLSEEKPKRIKETLSEEERSRTRQKMKECGEKQKNLSSERSYTNCSPHVIKMILIIIILKMIIIYVDIFTVYN